MKKAVKITGIILAVLVAIPLVLLLIVSIRTKLTQDDYSVVYTNPKYQNPASQFPLNGRRCMGMNGRCIIP